MKHLLLILCTLPILFSCRTKVQPSEIDDLAQELSSILDDSVISDALRVENDPEVDYVSRITTAVNKAAVQILDLISEGATVQEKSDFTLHVMSVIGMSNTVTGVTNAVKEHISYLIEVASSEKTTSTGYNEIKKALLDNNKATSYFTQFYADLTEYNEASDKLTPVLQEVLVLVSDDLKPAISKMTGPEVQEYYVSALKYLKGVATLEKERAGAILKAAEEYKRIN